MRDVDLTGVPKNAKGEYVLGGGGSASPLTTKGDIYTFSTLNARLGIGANGQVLTADSAEATGLKWASVAGTGDVVGPAGAVNNRVALFDGVTGKLLKDSGLVLAGNNTGDQTTIVGILGTKAQFDAAVTDGNILYVGDVTQYTDGMADARIAAQKGVAGGLASLDGSGKVPTSQLPALALTDVFVVGSQAAQLALTAEEGDVAVRTDLNKSYIHNGGVAGTMADWQELLTPTDAVISVNGQTGVITLSTTNIAEGTGLYFTDERAQDAVGNSLGQGLEYDDTTGAISAKVQMSITKDAFGVKLSGDSATPGNTKLYGTDGAGTKGWYAQPSGGSGATPVITSFTASGSYPAPTSGTMLRVRAIGGGAGGGTGRKSVAATGAAGGTGGGMGEFVEAFFLIADITFPVTVTIGAGGAGAAANTTDSTHGSGGSAGDNTAFGTYLTALGGLAGATANSSAGSCGQPRWPSQGVPPSSGLAAGAAGLRGHAGGGAPGGGKNTSNAAAVGGTGGESMPKSITGGSGGVIGGNGVNGNNGDTTTPFIFPFGSGGGGGGSRVASGGNAGNGGNGGLYGAGGGGGGAGLDATTNAGAGGNGGNGFLVVESF